MSASSIGCCGPWEYGTYDPNEIRSLVTSSGRETILSSSVPLSIGNVFDDTIGFLG